MENSKRLLALSAIATALVFAIGMYAGYRVFRPAMPKQPEINAQAILTALHDRGFLVTQTFIFDQPVTIKKTSGSAFKDFFLGQTIVARGTMEVNLGMDLANTSEQDVKVNGDTVTITLPRATLFNTRLVGPIDVDNTQGILKRIIDSDDGYNEALNALSKTAEEMAKRPELLQRADERAKEDVARLMGYVAEGKRIVVVLK